LELYEKTAWSSISAGGDIVYYGFLYFLAGGDIVYYGFLYFLIGEDIVYGGFL